MLKKSLISGLIILCILFAAIFLSKLESKSDSASPYFLSVCTVFKNDAPYLKEWIEYHKMLGVQHFRLYNDGSTDNCQEVLQPYIDKGDVTLIDWKKEPGSGVYAWINVTQTPAFFDAITQLRGKTKWLAIIDTDEFILPTKHENIVSFLNDYDKFSGIVLNWQCYGTSHVMDIPSDKLMIEVLTLKAEEKSEWNFPSKSIVKPEFIDTTKIAWAPHTWSYIPPHQGLMTNGNEYKFGVVDISTARINHYVHRSENYFWKEKIPKKDRMEGWKWPKDHVQNWYESCNKVEDNSIARHIPALRKRIFPDVNN